MPSQTSRPEHEALVARAADQFIEDLKAGKAPSIESYAEKYPKVAALIREVFPALLVLEEMPEENLSHPSLFGSTSDGNDREQVHPPTRELGDFRLLREIGRGGMGVVYEAEQLSLGRRVALKVLPFAAMLDEQQLKRFKNEARAAATLDHPHIVSIYSVGSERGVHYYAMQLVEGGSLAQLLAAPQESEPGREATPPAASGVNSETDTRAVHSSPSGTLPDFNAAGYYQTIARLGIQAASALDHAHAAGILHRDIKPGNLLIDPTGKLLVTDFGLARIESDATLTGTGDLVGTLRYMSPEQLEGDRAVVDHRSDIYSLGATLYELATRQPLYQGTERARLMAEIERGEPTAPRKVNRRIPVDLETIILKAIEREPGDRYASAKALAEDLQRFADDRPVLAKPPGVYTHFVRRARRHALLLSVGLGVSILLTTVLAASTLRIAQLRTVAESDREAAVEQRAIAAGERDVAVRERERAEQSQYNAEILAGLYLWQEGDISGLRQLLNRHIPAGSAPDRRGWEWYMLKTLCHPELKSVRLFGNPFPIWHPEGHIVGTPGAIWSEDIDRLLRCADAGLNGRQGTAWSPDGKCFAWGSASSDDAIYLWDLTTNEVHRLEGHGDNGEKVASVWCVAFSPDGKRIASGSCDRTVRIWDAATKKQIQQLSTGNNVYGVSWSPDGKRIAAAAVLFGLYVWDLESEEEIFRLPPDGEFMNVCWSHELNQLFYTSNSGCQQLDPETWKVQTRIPLKRGGRAIDVRSDGKFVALSDGEEIKLWDLEQGTLHSELKGHSQRVVSVAWHPQGERLLTSSVDNEMKLWSFAAGDGILHHRLPSAVSETQSFEADGSLTLIMDGALRRFNPSTGKEQDAPQLLTRDKSAFCQSRDHRLSLRKVSTGQQFDVVELPTQEVTLTIRVGEHQTLQSASFSPDNQYLATFCCHNTDLEIAVWSLARGKRISTCHIATTNPWNPSLHTWSPNSAYLAYIGSGDLHGAYPWDDNLHVIEVQSGARVISLCPAAEKARLTAMAWNLPSNAILLGDQNGHVTLVDVKRSAMRYRVKPHKQTIVSCDFHEGIQRIVCATNEGKVCVLAADDGRTLLNLKTSEDAPATVRWSHDGKQLVAVSQTGALHMWDASTGYDYGASSTRHGEFAWELHDQARSAAPDVAVEYLKQSLNLAPDRPEFWMFRATQAARLGRFELARSELSKMELIAIGPLARPRIDMAYAFLAENKLDEFRERTAELVVLAEERDLLSLKYYASQLCLLLPEQTGEPAEIARGRRLVLPGDDGETRGASAVRARRYREGIEILTELQSHLYPPSNPEMQFRRAHLDCFLAIAQDGLGNTNIARQHAESARETRKSLNSHVLSWQSLAILDKLLHELDSLDIETDTPTSGSS